MPQALLRQVCEGREELLEAGEVVELTAEDCSSAIKNAGRGWRDSVSCRPSRTLLWLVLGELATVWHSREGRGLGVWAWPS